MITFLHAARDGNCNRVIADDTCPSVATQAAVPPTSHMPLAAAIAAAAEKHRNNGNVLRILSRNRELLGLGLALCIMPIALFEVAHRSGS